jgi:uncharacterized RDD family membrane protein YckC
MFEEFRSFYLFSGFIGPLMVLPTLLLLLVGLSILFVKTKPKTNKVYFILSFYPFLLGAIYTTINIITFESDMESLNAAWEEYGGLPDYMYESIKTGVWYPLKLGGVLSIPLVIIGSIKLRLASRSAEISMPTDPTYLNENAIDYKYPSFWIRGGAYLIDLIILNIIYFISFIPLIFIFALLFPESSTFFTVSFVVLGLLIYWLYHDLFESSKYQATLGKILLGLKVTDLNGNKLSFLKASIRSLFKFISNILLGFGFLVVFFTEKRQALHDIIAKTIITRKTE